MEKKLRDLFESALADEYANVQIHFHAGTELHPGDPQAVFARLTDLGVQWSPDGVRTPQDNDRYGWLNAEMGNVRIALFFSRDQFAEMGRLLDEATTVRADTADGDAR